MLALDIVLIFTVCTLMGRIIIIEKEEWNVLIFLCLYTMTLFTIIISAMSHLPEAIIYIQDEIQEQRILDAVEKENENIQK